MSGTKAGGVAAAATNKRLYGDDWYKRLGAKGGRNGHTGGFAANPELARIAGKKGGTISRRRAATGEDITATIVSQNKKIIGAGIPIRELAIREPVTTKQEVADNKVSRLIKNLFSPTSSK